MGFLPLLGLFGNVAIVALSAAGVLSPATSKLITDLLSGVMPLVGSISSGQTPLQNVLSVLAGLSSVLNTLKADTSLPADKLALVNSLDSEVQAAIAAYIQAGTGYSPTNYTPITPVA